MKQREKMLTIAKDTSRALLSGWADFFWIVIGALFISILATIIALQTLGDPVSLNDQEQISIAKVSIAAPAIFLAGFLVFRPQLSFFSHGAPRSLKMALSIAAFLVAAKWTLNFIFDESAQFSLLRSDLVVVLLLCAFVPIVEEAFFRGLAWATFLKRSISELGALCATSLLFILAHIPNDLNSFVQVCGMAFSLGLMRYFSGSIWIGVAAHCIMNAVVLFEL